MASSKNSKIIYYALLGFLVVGLGGFGAQNFSGTVRSIGKVGDQSISVTTYTNALRQKVQSFSQQIGTPLSFQQAQAIGLDRAALSEVVTQAALDNETARLGLSVGDARVRDELLAIPAFQGLDGKFDREAYKQTLRQNGLSEREFEAQIRAEKARTLLQNAVLGGMAAQAAYVNVIAAYGLESRSFRLIRLGPDSLPSPVSTPDEAAIKAYYDANPEPFTRPEAKAITYAKLLPEMLLDQVAVDEAAIAALYQSRQAEYMQPERRLVERLVYASEAEAAAAKARIDAGTLTFEAAVAERGLTLADVDQGDQARDELGAAGEAVFALAGPGIVGPFVSNLGPALFRMNGILAAQETKLAEVHDTLKAELAGDDARKMILAQTSKIDDLLAGGATLEQLADETDMEVGQLDYFAGTDDPMAQYAALRQAAETLTAEDFPALVSLDDGGIVSLRLDSIKPPALKPLAEVQPQVIEAWKAAETQSRLKVRAEAVQTGLAAAATPQSLGVVVREVGPVKRTDPVSDAPDALLTSVFAMTEGETRLIEEPAMITLVTLAKIIPASTLPAAEGSDDAKLRATIESQVAQSLSGDIFDLFAKSLEESAGIHLDESVISAVQARMQ